MRGCWDSVEGVQSTALGENLMVSLSYHEGRAP
jgi:hypothetical protein